MSALHETSTHALAPRDRLAMWGDAVWRLIGGLQSDAFGDDNFNGRIVSGSAGTVGLCKLDATRHRVVRTPSLVRRSERPYLKVAVQLQGRACFEQNGRSVWLAPGEWSVYDTSHAYAVTNPGPVQQLVLMLPKDQWPERGLPLDALMVQRFSGACGVSRLAWDMMLNAFDELPTMSEAVADGVGDVLIQLLHLSLLERAGRPTGMTQREALRDRIRAHVQRHLRDPGLTPDRIASALNCSRRALYNAFAGEGAGVAGHILEQRLRGCARELAPRGARSVTDIALSWGFNNLAHFSRVFKARYGVAPRDYRGP
jgi:AraC-like DNA-binding protein